MQINWRIAVATGVTAAAVANAPARDLRAQGPAPQRLTAGGAALAPWAARVDAMLRTGQLDLADVQADPMLPGRLHERLSQRHAGLPVFGGEVVRQLDGRTLLSVYGHLFENVSVATLTPAIDAAGAAAIAERAAGDGASAGEPQLGILPHADGYLLVYRLVVRSPWDIRRYHVNAVSGAIEDSVSVIRSQTEEPSIARGTGVLNDDKKVSGTITSAGLQAIDLLRPALAFTLDFRGSRSRFNSFLQTGAVFFSDVAVAPPGGNWSDGAIVDAHVYQGWVYDYFFKRFGRRGLDDDNLQVISVVHPLARRDAGLYSPEIVGFFINNAAYLGDGFMLYGDGDGRLFDYLAGGLDVIAHELTHGVTDFTSRLEYRDEPGALNEAFSDIIATAVEFYHLRSGQGPQKGPNFLIGEDVTRVAPGYIRSLQNPVSAGDPDHYSLRRFIGTETDNGGVHINSSIVGHVFYLAVAGGRHRLSGQQVQGIGLVNMERMERIVYRAFAFLLGPLSQFSDARAATLQAATDLYGAGSHERAQLEQAWAAVGVQ